MNMDKTQARQRVRELAQRMLPAGDFAGFFDAVYTTANGDTNGVPWADLQPHPVALSWLQQQHVQGQGRRALVVGCGEFSFSRMSWVKPNFLWMMYRNGWGRKENQEVTLAVPIQCSAFDEILRQAVPSTYQKHLYASQEEWRQAVERSSVRVQWDPDHDPSGKPLERRAIQLGLRGEVLARYAREWIVEIEDISDFVAEQREHAHGDYAQLIVPRERVYSSDTFFPGTT